MSTEDAAPVGASPSQDAAAGGSHESPAPEAPGRPPRHLDDAARLYGVTADGLRSLGAYESEVYAFEAGAAPRILKVIDPSHRTPELVQAEVDWLLALSEAGVSVSEPVPAATGRYVEVLPDSGHVVVAFARAPGDLVPASRWTDDLLERWGRLLGLMQAQARGYEPPGPRRHALADHSYAFRADELEAEDPAFVAAASEVVARGAPLLRPDSPGLDGGLVHADLHSGNLLVFEGTLTAIDFDDCGYGSFAFDLAMPLYYGVRHLMRAHEGITGAEAAERFLGPFLRGFVSAAPLPAGGAEAIDLALRLRQVELVAAVHLKFLRTRGDEPGLRAVADDLRDRVVAGTEVVPLATLERFFG